MKFIHIADVHLGAKPEKNMPWAKEREEHSWQAFSDVITRAKEEQVQILLIAGNLFHRQPLIRELKEVNRQFSRIPQTQVVLVAGNRDYLRQNSCYNTFRWGENVHFLKEEKIRSVELEGLGIRVYGLSYWRREIRERLYDKVPAAKDDFCNILLAHGGDETHIPFDTKELEKQEFGYVALGHIHKPMQLVEHKIVMAGALQPVDCTETGEHGYFIGELKEGGCKVEFCPLHYCEYVSLSLKVSQDTTEENLKKVLQGRIEQAKECQLFKVILTGSCPSGGSIDTEELARMERVVQVVDRCHPDYDFEKLKLRHQHQILGRYIEALEKMPQTEITKKALYYGVEAMLAE